MAVEFALVLLPLLLIVFGTVQYGMYFFSAQTGTSVTREALRRVSVGDCQSAGELTSFVSTRLGAASTGGLTVQRTYRTPAGATSATPVVGGTVRLRVEFDTLNMHFPFVPFLADAALVREVDARMEDDIAGAACT